MLHGWGVGGRGLLAFLNGWHNDQADCFACATLVSRHTVTLGPARLA